MPSASSSALDRALRPQTRLTMRFSDSLLMHNRLLQLGKVVNAVGHHLMALSFFSCAHAAREDVNCIIAAANMRLHLDALEEFELAAAIYAQLLAEPSWELSDAQREVVLRKQAEAAAAIEACRAWPLNRHAQKEDMVQQIIRDSPEVADFPDGEADQLIMLLRKHGHAANESGETSAARQFFDCAFAVSRAPADLLSAANMRAKLFEGSAEAEALYHHVSADDTADERERAVAGRKLEALNRQRAALAAAGAAPAADDALGEAGGVDRAWIFATVLCSPEESDEDEPER